MALSTTKPTIFIVPGAWHSPPAYRQFAAYLEDLGYPTITAPLPSLDSKSPKTATCTEDANALRQKLISLIDADEKEVVVIAHSYGGIPTGGAAYGLSQTTRCQDGKKGGVIGLIYIAAFVVSEGSSLVEFLGGKHAPYVVSDQVKFSSSFSTLAYIC